MGQVYTEGGEDEDEDEALVQAQNAVNLTWDTAKGSNGAVRGSQKDAE